MMSDRDHRGAPAEPPSDQHSAPPARAIAFLLGAVAVALVAGYFFVMKLIDMGRTEDCLMSGRRDCAEIDMPVKR
jgi:hypothetical protein